MAVRFAPCNDPHDLAGAQEQDILGCVAFKCKQTILLCVGEGDWVDANGRIFYVVATRHDKEVNQVHMHCASTARHSSIRQPDSSRRVDSACHDPQTHGLAGRQHKGAIGDKEHRCKESGRLTDLRDLLGSQQTPLTGRWTFQTHLGGTCCSRQGLEDGRKKEQGAAGQGRLSQCSWSVGCRLLSMHAILRIKAQRLSMPCLKQAGAQH